MHAPYPLTVHGPVGDWFIFRRETVAVRENVSRKYGPVPFRVAGLPGKPPRKVAALAGSRVEFRNALLMREPARKRKGPPEIGAALTQGSAQK
jgi:hypothetical protein